MTLQRPWTGLLLAACVLLAASCLGKKVESPAVDPSEEGTAAAAGQPSDSSAPNPPESVDDLKKVLEQERKQKEALRQKLAATEAALASLEEHYAALEIELASLVEEVLRSKASLRSVHNRALAISRIAEVRVQLQSVPQAEDKEVAARLERANEFLSRADTALAESNFGGASYLAERAGDLVRQATMVAEVRASPNQSEEVIPIVPPRSLEVVVNANLREGPSTDRSRVGQIEKGKEILAVARWRDWFQIETDAGFRAWIHGSVVR